MSDIAISSRSCTERHGDFSESVVFHSSYEVSCLLFVFWLCSLVSVFVVCLCWLLLGCWMGDTLGIVSHYSHAWEWTIYTNRMMTVRASSAHGTGTKKKCQYPLVTVVAVTAYSPGLQLGTLPQWGRSCWRIRGGHHDFDFVIKQRDCQWIMNIGTWHTQMQGWDAIGLANTDNGTLWETADRIPYRWRVQLSFQYRKQMPRLLYS